MEAIMNHLWSPLRELMEPETGVPSKIFQWTLTAEITTESLSQKGLLALEMTRKPTGDQVGDHEVLGAWVADQAKIEAIISLWAFHLRKMEGVKDEDNNLGIIGSSGNDIGRVLSDWWISREIDHVDIMDIKVTWERHKIHSANDGIRQGKINTTSITTMCTPLHWAAFRGHSEVVQQLFDRGADLEIKELSGRTPLTLAASEGLELVFQQRIRRGGTLHWEAFRGHSGVVRLLLDRGADMEVMEHKWRTPLSLAASEGLRLVVLSLLGRKGDFSIPDKNGWTPLHWAAFKGHSEICRLLVEKGAELQVTEINGRTPLSLATSEGLGPVVGLLLQNGADISIRT